MTDYEKQYVKRCIKENVHRFYIWKQWKKVRLEVLELDHHECQDCKARGEYTPATIVHHNQYLKKHPELALETYYFYDGVKYRNLISLCHDCHEIRHGHRKKNEYKEPLTEERWD